jgi:hypothetical protein
MEDHSSISQFVEGQDAEKGLTDASTIWTVERVMDELNCSRSTINNRILAGHLNPVKKGRKIYFNPNEVLKLSENLKKERIYRKTPGVIQKLKPPVENISVSRRQKSSGKENYDGYEPSAIGKLSAMAVRLYDAGKSCRDVVTQLEVSFELANHFYEQWKMAGSDWHLPSRSLLYLRQRFDWSEEHPTPEGFVTAINKYMNDSMKKTSSEESTTIQRLLEAPEAPDAVSNTEKGSERK